MTPNCAEHNPGLEGRGIPERDAYALLRAVVQECIDQGRFRPELRDADLAAQTLWAGVHGLCSLQIAMSGNDWVKWRPVKSRLNHLLETLFNGILPP